MIERRFVLQHPETKHFYRETYKGRLIWTPLESLATHYTDGYVCSLQILLQQRFGVYGLQIVEIVVKPTRIRIISSRAERSCSKSSDWFRRSV